MRHKIGDKLLSVCRSIVAENRSVEEWAEFEADDYFQMGCVEGGFDATEEEFCFSVYVQGEEYWLQLSLQDVEMVAKGELREVTLISPDC